MRSTHDIEGRRGLFLLYSFFIESAEEGDLVLAFGGGDIYEILKEVVGLRKEGD